MVAFLRELEMESAHVAGNSSGWWTALEMANSLLDVLLDGLSERRGS